MPRRWNANLVVLLGYAAISFAYFGWPLLPHPGRDLIGSSNDPQTYIWSFAWMLHAIETGTNPLVSHFLYAPSGVNLTWTVSVPGLAFVFSPLTALFGPSASYNIAALLMPPLAAWTAYLLCRYLTRSLWASVIGGYLFGFSASILRDQLWGNFHVTAVFLLPLVALVVIRFLRAELSGRGLAGRLGLLLGFQFWISTEFTFTATVFLLLTLVLSFWLIRDIRPRIRSALGPLVAGYALAGLIATPILVYALLGYVDEPLIEGHNGGDLLGFVIPTHEIALGGSSFSSLTSGLADGGAGFYLGVPVLLMVIAFGVRTWRAAGTRFVLAALVITAILALGPELLVDGHSVVALPWDALLHLPGFSSAFPFRLSAYNALAAAVIVALWIASTKGRIYSRPYMLPLLAVVALVPAFWKPLYHQHPPSVTFFTDGLYKSCIPPNETVVGFPWVGAYPLWQAETGMQFRLAENGIAPFFFHGKPLDSFDANRMVWELTYVDDGLPTMNRLLAFAATHNVGRILALPGGYPSRAQMRRFGPTELIGGMLVSPACGQPPLTQRDLTKYVKEDPHEVRNDAPNIAYCTGAQLSELPEGLYPVGVLAGAKRAIEVAGQGITCAPPPAGYKHHGFATPDMGVPADTYALYEPS